MNPQTLQFLGKYVDKLTNAIVKISPSVWNTMLAVYRFDAIGMLVASAIGLIVSVALWVVGLRVCKRYDWDLGECAPAFGGLAMVIVGFVGTLVAIGFLLTPWTWIAAFNPGLAIAHDAISKVMSQ